MVAENMDVEALRGLFKEQASENAPVVPNEKVQDAFEKITASIRESDGSEDDERGELLELLEAFARLDECKSEMVNTDGLVDVILNLIKEKKAPKQDIAMSACVLAQLWQYAWQRLNDEDTLLVSQTLCTALLGSTGKAKEINYQLEAVIIKGLSAALPFASITFIEAVSTASLHKAIVDILKKPKDRDVETLDDLVAVVCWSKPSTIEKNLMKALKSAKLSDVGKSLSKLRLVQTDQKSLKKAKSSKPKEKLAFFTVEGVSNPVNLIAKEVEERLGSENMGLIITEDDVRNNIDVAVSAEKIVFVATPDLQRCLPARLLLQIIQDKQNTSALFVKPNDSRIGGWLEEFVSNAFAADPSEPEFASSVFNHYFGKGGEKPQDIELHEEENDEQAANDEHAAIDDDTQQETAATVPQIAEVMNPTPHPLTPDIPETLTSTPEVQKTPSTNDTTSQSETDLEKAVQAAIGPLLARVIALEEKLNVSEQIQEKLAGDLHQAHLKIDDLEAKLNMKVVPVSRSPPHHDAGGGRNNPARQSIGPYGAPDPKVLSARSQMAAVMRNMSPPKANKVKINKEASPVPEMQPSPTGGYEDKLHPVFGAEDLE